MDFVFGVEVLFPRPINLIECLELRGKIIRNKLSDTGGDATTRVAHLDDRLAQVMNNVQDHLFGFLASCHVSCPCEGSIDGDEKSIGTKAGAFFSLSLTEHLLSVNIATIII